MKTFYDLEIAKTDYYHIDVMDGKFVEKDTACRMYSYASSIKQMSNIPLDVHLMVKDVKEYMQKVIDNFNKSEPLYKNISKIKIRDTEFPKTTTKKIKRG